MNLENINIDQETLDSLTQEGGVAEGVNVGLPLDGLQEIFMIVYGVVAVLGVIFLILFIIMAVMRIREHRATMSTQKDIKAIRELLEKNLNKTDSRDKVLLASEPTRENSNIS